MNFQEIKIKAKEYSCIPLSKIVDAEERYYNSNVEKYDSYMAGATMMLSLTEAKDKEIAELKAEKDRFQYLYEDYSSEVDALQFERTNLEKEIAELKKQMFSKDEMIDFAWFMFTNLGQYSDDKTAN